MKTKTEKIFYVIITILSLTTIIEAQTGWYQLNSGTTNNLYSICFINQNTGFIVGYNATFLKTTNAGLNWVSINITQRDLYDIKFLNDKTGYCTGTYGTILKTTNSGLNWITVLSSTYYTPYSCIDIIDSNKAFAVGTTYIAAAAVSTTNGGLNWTESFSSLETFYSGVKFINGQTGFISGPDTKVKITTNFGLNWVTKRVESNKNYALYSIDALNENFIFVVGDTGNILKSINSGQNWVKKNSGTNEMLRDIVIVNNQTLYICGHNGLVFKSTDAGESWVVQNTGVTETLQKVFFINLNTGYIVGEQGRVLKTTSGGIGIQKISDIIPTEMKLYQNYPNPFNSNTIIKFEIPLIDEENNYVDLSIYSIDGKFVTNILNENLRPGEYQADLNMDNKASGIYYALLRYNDIYKSIKLILLK
jgi:photosystem II stability/assembly factor-like uncharacterized protein